MLAALEPLAPDVLLFGGDVAGGPMPRETVDLLRSLEGARFVRGNGDREHVDGTAEGIGEWAGTQLDEEQRAFLRGFEPSIVLDDVLYCHAAPDDDMALVTILTPDALAAEIIGTPEQRTVVIGHTHMQFERRLGEYRLVNAGSVGMPYEDEPGAYWALVRDGEPELRRTAYDLSAAAARVAATEWPLAERWIAENLLSVPTAEEAAAFLESQRG